MKYWSVIKEKLEHPTELANQLLLIVLGAYAFIMADQNIRWKVPLLFVGLLTWLFLRHKTKHPIIWIVLLTLLFSDLYNLYFRVANHHFMLTFMVLSIISYTYHNRNDVLFKNIQLLLVIVVMTSAFQKVFSSQFMSGDFYYYLLSRGYIFDLILNNFPEYLEIIEINNKNILALQETDPNLRQSIVLKDSLKNISLICQIYAWITILIEFLVALAILFKPKSIWTHLLLIVLIIGILCARLEVGFMSLLAISGLYLCGNVKLRLFYTMIALGCLTFIIAKIGYH